MVAIAHQRHSYDTSRSLILSFPPKLILGVWEWRSYAIRTQILHLKYYCHLTEDSLSPAALWTAINLSAQSGRHWNPSPRSHSVGLMDLQTECARAGQLGPHNSDPPDVCWRPFLQPRRKNHENRNDLTDYWSWATWWFTKQLAKIP